MVVIDFDKMSYGDTRQFCLRSTRPILGLSDCRVAWLLAMTPTRVRAAAQNKANSREPGCQTNPISTEQHRGNFFRKKRLCEGATVVAARKRSQFGCSGDRRPGPLRRPGAPERLPARRMAVGTGMAIRPGMAMGPGSRAGHVDDFDDLDGRAADHRRVVPAPVPFDGDERASAEPEGRSCDYRDHQCPSHRRIS